MWEATIVEVSLKWFLELWETRNNDVHGHTKTEQTTRLQTRHRITARRMMAQRPMVRPSDQWMFPTDPDAYLETATAHQLGTWIASRRKTIKEQCKDGCKGIFSRHCQYHHILSTHESGRRGLDATMATKQTSPRCILQEKTTERPTRQ